MEALAIKGVLFAGTNIFASMIYDIYGLLKDTTTHPMVFSVMVELDLEADLKVIEALVAQFNLENFEAEHPVTISLKNVEEMISKIKSEMIDIKTIADSHKQKWFHYWRNPDCKPQLKRLTRNKKILDKRVDMLIDLLKVSEL
jgi:hypothetical protein